MRWSQTCLRVAACAMAVAGAVRVQAQENFRATEFREKDKNRDGYLSRAEYAGHPGNFRALDDDGDGRLSRPEFVDRAGNQAVPRADVPQPVPDAVTARYQSRDVNHDGVVSRAEWRDEPASFNRVDRDDDGRITLDEYRNRRADDNEDRFFAEDGNRDGVLSRREWGEDGARFDRTDRNNDGVVSLQEFGDLPTARYRQERFEDLDDDRNGNLTRREWRGEVADFDRLDRNNDRVVSRWEFRDRSPVDAPEDWLEDLDRNRDGRVSRGEWPGDAESFTILDRSRDRVLSRDELRDRTRLSERFRRLDRNDDGRISSREWQGSADAFAFFDRDRDGTVTRDEYAG